MVPRLHAPLVRHGQETVTLSGDEHHYLRHVLRLGERDEVRVFDGRGGEWTARVAGVARQDATLTLGDAVRPAPEPLIAVTLAIGVLKPDYMDDAVRDAAMLGIAAIQPLITVRSLPGRFSAASAADRWRRVVLASVRQCGRAVVPPVAVPQAYSSWLAARPAEASVELMLCEPRLGAASSVDLSMKRAAARAHGVVLLVGPEGGWEEAEVSTARDAGFIPWTVNRRVLRADAVSVAALSVLYYMWDGEHDDERTSPSR